MKQMKWVNILLTRFTYRVLTFPIFPNVLKVTISKINLTKPNSGFKIQDWRIQIMYRVYVLYVIVAHPFNKNHTELPY